MNRFRRASWCLAGLALGSVPAPSHALPDLITSVPPPGWSLPAVPNSLGPSVTLAPQALLPASTYWMLSAYNQGNEVAASPFNIPTVVTLDDRSPCFGFMDGVVDNNVAPGSWATGSLGNIASYYDVKPGRHTVRSIVDGGPSCSPPGGNVVESDETNNEWDRQFIWSWAALGTGDLAFDTPASMSYDPPAMTPGYGPYFNAEGLSGSTGANNWYAFAVMSMDTTGASDVDVRLNTETPMNIPQQGFGAYQKWSAEPGANIDFVVIDCNRAPRGRYYASALSNTGTANKIVEFDMDKGLLANPGTSGPFLLDWGFGGRSPDLVELHEIYLQTGYSYQISTYTGDGDADIGLSVYDPASGFATKAETVPGGFANDHRVDESVTIVPAASDFYGVVVWRVDARWHESGASYDVVVTKTPLPNLTASTPSGWFGPIVPRTTMDATGTYAPLPSVLPGNSPTTSFNWSVIDNGLGSAPSFWTELRVDDVTDHSGHFVGTLPSGSTFSWMNQPFETVRGGRHHVRLLTDSNSDVTETNETDNDTTDWFVWTPLDLAAQSAVLRPAPPIPFPVGSGPYPSCDGFRVPGFQGSYWTAVGMAPTSMTADYDVRLHTASAGSRDGFGASLASSLDPQPGSLDFCIVNYNIAPNAPYDVSVTNANGASETFNAQRADATYLGPLVDGITHSGAIDFAGGFLNLFEFYLGPSLVGTPIYLSVNNLDPRTDIRLDLFDGSIAYHSKSTAMASADANGLGGDEHLPAVTFGHAGFYALMVSKASGAPLPPITTASLFELVFSTGVPITDAPSVAAETPTLFSLSAPRPNPFGGETTVELTVPPGKGSAHVAVYDLRGRRIADLADEPTPGRYRVTWDGRDSAGRRAAAGVYFIRLEGPKVRETRKITLLR